MLTTRFISSFFKRGEYFIITYTQISVAGFFCGPQCPLCLRLIRCHIIFLQICLHRFCPSLKYCTVFVWNGFSSSLCSLWIYPERKRWEQSPSNLSAVPELKLPPPHTSSHSYLFPTSPFVLKRGPDGWLSKRQDIDSDGVGRQGLAEPGSPISLWQGLKCLLVQRLWFQFSSPSTPILQGIKYSCHEQHRHRSQSKL